MKSNSIKRYWKQWLKQNLLRFNYQPIFVENYSNGLVYRFKGTTKQISLVITFDGHCESMISFDDVHGKNFDHTVIGYEPLHCSKDELSQKVFEPIIQFTNDFFTCNHRLYLVNYENATEAFIGKEDAFIEATHVTYSIVD